MSLEKICADKYTDGIHKVKHKLTGDESYVYVGEAWLHDDDFYMVLDCKTDKVINNDDYEHLKYYEDGRYFECSDHKGEWLFNDGDEHCDECPKCKEVQEEILSYKVADDIYQYNNNREFNRLKYLLKADKYRDHSSNHDCQQQRGLLVLITEYDMEWGETYYYYKTIEKSFIDGLEWSET